MGCGLRPKITRPAQQVEVPAARVYFIPGRGLTPPEMHSLHHSNPMTRHLPTPMIFLAAELLLLLMSILSSFTAVLPTGEQQQTAFHHHPAHSNALAQEVRGDLRAPPAHEARRGPTVASMGTFTDLQPFLPPLLPLQQPSHGECAFTWIIKQRPGQY